MLFLCKGEDGNHDESLLRRTTRPSQKNNPVMVSHDAPDLSLGFVVVLLSLTLNYFF